MKCKYEGCMQGVICVGKEPDILVTRDMALDACEPALEGQVYCEGDYIWDACPCCEGPDWEDCPRCSGREPCLD